MVVLYLAIAPSGLLAHHSVAGFFDPQKTVDIEGIIRKVRWRNPHTVFEVDVVDAAQKTTTWHIESGALGVLRSRGLAREFVQAGDRVKIMGDSSLRSAHEMFARNMLLENGKEVLLTAGSKPYFLVEREVDILEAVFDEEVIAAARASADGLFRVWSTDIDNRSSDRLKMFNGEYPLLPGAREIRAGYDAGNLALLGCTRWSMPRLMANPLPMEFVKSGDDILLRFEEDDNVRVIHMLKTAADIERELSTTVASTLGYSTGNWDGETLLVETSRIAPDRLDDHGTPFSAGLHLLERFSLSNDDHQLDYKLTITDPETFAAPIEMGRQWQWRPEITVGRYACEEDQQLR